MSRVIRSVKNVTKGYTTCQIKVREATSNDRWGPTGKQMEEIAHLTYNASTELYEIMDILEGRLNDKGKNWRHVLKSLKVLDYCLHEGSEMVVTWARQNLYIIKTLREFQYMDDEYRDVGQNVRVAAKELTSLLLDEERLREERKDRKSWKSRVSALDEHPLPEPSRPESSRQQPRVRPPVGDEDDTEYRLALEASKYQEEEDRRRREGNSGSGDDADLAKAIKLSKEEEAARRRRELEQNDSLFDDDAILTPPATQPFQPMNTGFNQGYQQGSAVDFLANPIDASQTGFIPSAYTGISPQSTTFQQVQHSSFSGNPYINGLGVPQMQSNMSVDSFGMPNQTTFQPQQTSSSPYNQPRLAQSDPALQPGNNNPWVTSSSASPLQQTQTGIKPPGSDSNNPFGASYGRQPSFRNVSVSSLGTLPESKLVTNFPQPASFTPSQPSSKPTKVLTGHEAKLNALLSSGDGMDTFGNTGNMRISAQHTAPGMFINSAGTGISRLTAEHTGSNPFLRSQMTAMPSVGYGVGRQSTGYPALNGGQSNNPFASGHSQQPGQGNDLISFN